MNSQERSIPVPAALRSWVSGVSVATTGAEDDQQTVIDAPETATTLVLRATPDGHGDLVVMGPRSRALYHVGAPGPLCVKIRIHPGRARPLLGRSVSELLDRVVPLSNIWGDSVDRLARELADLGTEPAAHLDQPTLQRLEGAVLGRLAPTTRSDLFRTDLAYTATRILSASAKSRPERMGTIARRLNISERHLRALFTQAVGISPRHFVRIERVRTVVARASRVDLARLATEAGYYDQSHMTAEFRRIMGVPPGAFVAGRLPPASPCGPRPAE